MAQNLSKKFSLLICCLMTMQALRLVISTAGFCVVRFHIDCSLFNIFISRLVNAVMMSQLFGNWLGDLIVFALAGKAKLWALMLANWTEFFCFCTALFSIMHTECGHLNGFYWSMVNAYFWWKVGEAPSISIAAPESTDYYFAGFTLSGVWASCLKGLVMRCVAGNAKPLHFKSDALGDVNVKIVGARSVKTTVDYRASKYLFIITIVLMFLMCASWSAITNKVEDQVTTGVNETTQDTGGTMDATEVKEWDADVGPATGDTNWKGSKAGMVKKDDHKTLQVIAGIAFGGVLAVPGAMLGVGVGEVFALCFKCCLPTAKYASLTKWCQLIFGIVGAAGGMASGVWPCTKEEEWDDSAAGGTHRGWIVPQKWAAPYAEKKEATVQKTTGGSETKFKYDTPWKPKSGKEWEDVMTHMAPMAGLVGGLAVGALVGWGDGRWMNDDMEADGGRSQLWLAAIESGRHSELVSAGKKKTAMWRGTALGAFIGSFFGLWFGEILTGALTGQETMKKVLDATDAEKVAVVFCGFLIVVLGCGTVYSIYPGMAPCSITQFKYFNIIDILILILSSIAPLVIMYGDLGGRQTAGWKLANTILGVPGTKPGAKWGWLAVGVLLLISTNVCEIIVLHIMQHPHSKMAQKVTNSGWRAVLLTVTMVTSQLTSTGVGFGSVAAGSGFNDGIYNALSTVTLWTMECCAVLGEGYLTELKKYEPGKWPTQGMGRRQTFKWWFGRAFGNAWQIWCCIGTTNLRRDIMLCRQ